jgi:uncharacterized protein YuzE
VPEYKFTEYFEKEVLRKRPYLKKEWCIRVCGKAVEKRTSGGKPLSVLGGNRGTRGTNPKSYHVGRQNYDSQCFPGQRVQDMKLNYYSETDSLYIDLSEQPSVESREISEGIVLDYDATGNLVGIDIDNASRKVELKKLTVNKLPAVIQNNSA